ncbi:DUF3265 domain-containing protein [Vibrio vulnificus]|nr:DUF3265 domain-containing protein [Vibrio vulnificus]MCU8221259.1 DUF3265 domain-containing protein [Vibrio vulnificus]
MCLKHNKAFKRDSCRVAFLVCGDFCGESGVLKLSVCGIHPLTQRYVLFHPQQNSSLGVEVLCTVSV